MGATAGYNKIRKAALAKSGAIRCGHCRCNRGENVKRHPRPDRYKLHRRSVSC